MNDDVALLTVYAETLQSMRDAMVSEEDNDALAEETLIVIEELQEQADEHDVVDVVGEMLFDAQDATYRYIDEDGTVDEGDHDDLDNLFKFLVVYTAGVKHNEDTMGPAGMYH